MFASRNEYDRGVNTYSPEGRLFQVEYALGAIKLGSTAIGIETKEGIILASERRVSMKLMEPGSIEKLNEIDSHIACAMSGLISDAQTLVQHAQTECAHHNFVFNEKMSTQSCADSVSELVLDFSNFSEGKKRTMSRPFGVALLLAGVDNSVPSLFCVDPSGTITKYKATAVGCGQEGAENMLKEKYDSNMTLSEAEELSLFILRQVMEEKLTSTNVEVASITVKSSKVKMYSKDDIENLITKLPPPTLPTPHDARHGRTSIST